MKFSHKKVSNFSVRTFFETFIATVEKLFRLHLSWRFHNWSFFKVASTPFFAFWSKVWNKIWLLTSDSLKAFGQSSKINEFCLVGRNMPSVNSRCAFHTPNFHSIIGFCVSVVDLTFMLTNTLLSFQAYVPLTCCQLSILFFFDTYMLWKLSVFSQSCQVVKNCRKCGGAHASWPRGCGFESRQVLGIIFLFLASHFCILKLDPHGDAAFLIFSI